MDKSVYTSTTVPAIVVDIDGYKVEFVAVDKETGTAMFYDLKDDEQLIFDDVETANNMIKPHWNGEAWEETATPEEIEAAQPKPMLTGPTPSQQLSEIDIILLAIDDIYKKISGGDA